MPTHSDALDVLKQSAEPLRVLLIEDNDDDATLVEWALRAGGYDPLVTRVEDADGMLSALSGDGHDVIVSDFSLPSFGASKALELYRDLDVDIPFIVVSGTVGEEAAVSAMRAGAHDFIVKTNLARLVPAIRRETGEAQRRRQHGETQVALRDTSALLGAIFTSSPAAIFMTDATDFIELWNPAAAEIFHAQGRHVIGRSLVSGSFDGTAIFAELAYRVRQGEEVRGRQIDWRVRDRPGMHQLSVSAAPIADPTEAGGLRGIVWVVLDVSEQHRLGQQLEHAQRMEAVGRLAGGIAHDFNNILTAITGYSDFLLTGLPPTLEDMRADVLEIRTAAQRATRLTHQLLAFSRRQVLQPQPLDLNVVVTDVESMLRRVMGDQVYIVTRLEEGLPAAWADRGQVEQILMNLVVNARDAVADGGTIVIHTATATAGEEQSALEPGQTYVTLEVRDDGPGMEPELLERIFEPFFTTKAAGKGTGLGLSTVYGIVQQSGGHIEVESMPGEGTSFRIWLRQPTAEAPRAHSAPRAEPPRAASHTPLTILLVEDEPAVRAVAARTLVRAGHTVLQAGSGPEALRVANGTSIDLLLSDVMMGGMSGTELAALMRERRPDLPAVFMSGYSEEDIPRDAALRDGENFLEKPFTPDGLLHCIERVMRVAGQS